MHNTKYFRFILKLYHKKAVIYIRVACKEAINDAIMEQKELINRYLKTKSNIKVSDYYIDDGYSGTNLNRPAFKKMLQDIKNNKIDEVIVKDFTRISRNYFDLSECIENFKNNNVKIISIYNDTKFQNKLKKSYLLKDSKEVG